MAYNSSHTGAQIDAAVGAVIEKESTWDGKQNKLTAGTDYATPEQVAEVRSVGHKITLTVAGWDNSTKQQTVSVADVKGDETAQDIVPRGVDQSMNNPYDAAGIRCIGQAAGSLTFQCDTIPTADIPVYIRITPLAFS